MHAHVMKVGFIGLKYGHMAKLVIHACMIMVAPPLIACPTRSMDAYSS